MRSILRPVILVAILGGFGWYIYNKTDLGTSLQHRNTQINSGVNATLESGIIDQSTGVSVIGSIDSLLESETTGSVDELLLSGGNVLSGMETNSGFQTNTGSAPIAIFAETGSTSVQSGIVDNSLSNSTGTNSPISEKELDEIISESEEVIGFRKGAIIKNYQNMNTNSGMNEKPSATGVNNTPVEIKNNIPATTSSATNINKQIGCRTPWGTNIKHGDYTLAFKSSKANVCEFEKRYCYQGNLQGSFVNHTCHFQNGNGSYLYKGQKSQSLDELIKKSSNTSSQNENYSLFGSNTNSNNNQIVATTNQANSKQINSQKLSIGIEPIKNENKLLDEKILSERNPNDNGTFNSSVKPQQRSNVVLASSSFKDSYKSDVTVLKGGTCTTPWGQMLGDGQSTLAFESQSAPDGIRCSFETRYCENGTLAGSYQFPVCNHTNQESMQHSCAIGSRNIPHGGVIITAQKPFAKNGEKCIYEARYCNNGLLQGNYQYLECNS